MEVLRREGLRTCECMCVCECVYVHSYVYSCVTIFTHKTSHLAHLNRVLLGRR